MADKHALPDRPDPKGEVFVDTEDHTVFDTSVHPARVVGRTRTQPTKHDGSQRKR